MKIRKVEPSVGILGKILNIFSKSDKDTYSCKYIDSNMQGGLLDKLFPVGRGFIDFTDTDYSNYLGFTWERELVGMVGVGLDINQTEFNTIGKTGGSKYLQKHSHLLTMFNQYADGTGGHYANSKKVGKTTDGADDGSICEDISMTGTGDSGNLQPYKVVAYWKRVA